MMRIHSYFINYLGLWGCFFVARIFCRVATHLMSSFRDKDHRVSREDFIAKGLTQQDGEIIPNIMLYTGVFHKFRHPI